MGSKPCLKGLTKNNHLETDLIILLEHNKENKLTTVHIIVEMFCCGNEKKNGTEILFFIVNIYLLFISARDVSITIITFFMLENISDFLFFFQVPLLILPVSNYGSSVCAPTVLTLISAY